MKDDLFLSVFWLGCGLFNKILLEVREKGGKRKVIKRGVIEDIRFY